MCWLMNGGGGSSRVGDTDLARISAFATFWAATASSGVEVKHALVDGRESWVEGELLLPLLGVG